MKNKLSTKWIVLIIVLAALALALILTHFITDWLWFAELGYVAVFLKKLLTELTYGLPAFVIITALCYLYLLSIKRAYYKKIGGYLRSEPEKKVNLSALGLSALFGLITGFRVANRLWFQILEYFNSTDFGITDPIFGRDVAFYIFKLEFWQKINGMLIYIVIGFAVVNLLYYLVLLHLRKPQFYEQISDEEYQAYQKAYAEYEVKKAQWQQQQRTMNGAPGGGMFGGIFGNMAGAAGAPTPPPKPAGNTVFSKEAMSKLLSVAELQFKVLGVIFFLMVALHFFLQQFTLLYSDSSSVVYGAGFTDINVTLWQYRLLMVLAVAAAVFTSRNRHCRYQS